jgi:hypothetical protein
MRSPRVLPIGASSWEDRALRWYLVILLLIALGLLLLLPHAAGQQAPGKTAQRTVIPFDFESKFDGGDMGQTLGDSVWQKLERQGGFVLPESMLDVRDWCKQHHFVPGPDTPLDRMKTVVRREQGGDIGIWGKVERVPGAGTDVYDLWIVIVDFTVEPPRTVYRKQARTKTVSEIPHLYLKEALAALYGTTAVASAPPGDLGSAEARWANGPNLVQGDFDKGLQAPLGWEPLPGHVSWPRDAAGNRIIRFTIPQDVAESTGVHFYSDYFLVQAGATYRLQCRWKSTGTAAKVFVKCYDEFQSDFRGKGASSSNQRREVYRSQQNLSGPPGRWNLHTQDFTPKHSKFTPRWGRVMLFAYYPAGTVEWDDVVVKQLGPAPPAR